jgi:hypothetical protein
MTKCSHGKWWGYCRECKRLGIGVSQICEHDRKRRDCKDCKKLGIGGENLCEHGRMRDTCKICKDLGIGGISICRHNRRKQICKECKIEGVGGSGICQHNRQTHTCSDCKELGIGGVCLCSHGRRRCLICDSKGSYNRHRQVAEDREISTTLTYDEFKCLIRDCEYCGRSVEELGSMGIDRVDNTLGYVFSNCVPCCGTCNTMKMALGLSEFLDHVRRIADHQMRRHWEERCKTNP